MIDIVKNAEGLFKTIDKIVKDILKKTKFNYTDEGTVISKNNDGTYKVRINGSTTDIKSLHGVGYKENDVVYILIVNQDFNKKFILDKKYS